MLNNSFYSILKKEKKGNELYYKVKLNSKHPIYKGHFPEMPATPGVCQVAIIKECLEDSFNKELFLRESGNIKFVRLNTPEEENELNVIISYIMSNNDIYKITAKITDNQENIILKLKGEFGEQL